MPAHTIVQSNSATKHTPGPWRYEATSGAIFYDDGDVEPIIASTNLECVSLEQGDADGVLIAAAPDMLEALRAVSGLDINHSVLRAVDAAIAKAEGRS